MDQFNDKDQPDAHIVRRVTRWPPREKDTATIFDPRFRLGLVSSGAILVAYFGWFFVRSHIAIASAVLKQEGLLTSAGYARMQSVAFVCNALSKVVAGTVVNVSGRPKYTFLCALALCVAMVALNTVLTAFGWMAVFMSATRFLSAFGRVASLTIVATWFPRALMGRMSGLINVGVNLGEVVSRLLLGSLLLAVPWPTMFWIAAGIAAALGFPCVLLTRDRPPSSDNEPGMPSGAHAGSAGSFASRVVAPLLREPRFYCSLVMAVGTTAIRETFLQFTPSFYCDALGASAANSAVLTAVYNLPAAGSALLGGYLLDVASRRLRGLVPLAFLAATMACLAALAGFTYAVSVAAPGVAELSIAARLVIANVIVACSSLALSAPNSFLDGVFVVDIAGPAGAAFASGFVSSFGYIGSAAAAASYGSLTETAAGWARIWAFNAVVCLLTCGACLVYWILDVRYASDTPEASISGPSAPPVLTAVPQASPSRDICESPVRQPRRRHRHQRRRSCTAIVDTLEQVEVLLVTEDASTSPSPGDFR